MTLIVGAVLHSYMCCKQSMRLNTLCVGALDASCYLGSLMQFKPEERCGKIQYIALIN